MDVIKTCSKTHHHLSDQIIFMRHWNISLENLNIFITLPLKQGFWKTKTFFKKREHCLIVERTTIENAIFHTKLSCQKPVSRQVEWGVQNGPITKNGVLTLTIWFFWKFNFGIKTSYHTWFKVLTTQMFEFMFLLSVMSFILGCFFNVSILKKRYENHEKYFNAEKN